MKKLIIVLIAGVFAVAAAHAELGWTKTQVDAKYKDYELKWGNPAEGICCYQKDYDKQQGIIVTAMFKDDKAICVKYDLSFTDLGGYDRKYFSSTGIADLFKQNGLNQADFKLAPIQEEGGWTVYVSTKNPHLAVRIATLQGNPVIVVFTSVN